MKQLLLLFILLISITNFYSQTFNDGVLEYTVINTENNYVSVGKYNNTFPTGDIVIPETLEESGITYTVTSIEDNAFRDCTSLSNITLPNSIINIGNYAFSGCTNLTNIDFPNSIISIGDFAFNNCRSLISIVLPDSLTSIGDNAFRTCVNVTNITLPNSLDLIGASVFRGCNVTNIILPETLISIGDLAFYNNGLTNLELPSSLESIGASAFANNNLINVTLPNSLEFIGNFAFAENELESLTLPNSLESIDSNGVFANNRLTTVTLPNTLTSIGASVFSRNRLINIILPDAITSIGDSAFAENELKSIRFPDSLESIGSSVFSNNSLTNIIIPDTVTSIGSWAFTNNRLTSITLPESLVSIGFRAFYGNELESIILPSSLGLIGSEAFSSNTSLTSVTSNNETPTYLETDVFNDRSIIDLFIPKGTNQAYLDQNWTGFKTVIVNHFNDDVLKYIVIDTDNNYVSVRKYNNICPTGDLVIPETVVESGVTYTVTLIEDNAFYNCTSLNSIDLPDSIESIGDNAFYNCTSLNSVTVNWQTPLDINANVFEFVTISDIPLKVPSGIESLYQSASVWEDFDYNTLSTEELNNETFQVYVNRNLAQIELKLKTTLILKQVNLYSINGKHSYANEELIIPMANLSNGIYVLVVETNHGKSAKKIIL